MHEKGAWHNSRLNTPFDMINKLLLWVIRIRWSWMQSIVDVSHSLNSDDAHSRMWWVIRHKKIPLCDLPGLPLFRTNEWNMRRTSGGVCLLGRLAGLLRGNDQYDCFPQNHDKASKYSNCSCNTQVLYTLRETYSVQPHSNQIRLPLHPFRPLPNPRGILMKELLLLIPQLYSLALPFKLRLRSRGIFHWKIYSICSSL